MSAQAARERSLRHDAVGTPGTMMSQTSARSARGRMNFPNVHAVHPRSRNQHWCIANWQLWPGPRQAEVMYMTDSERSGLDLASRAGGILVGEHGCSIGLASQPATIGPAFQRPHETFAGA